MVTKAAGQEFVLTTIINIRFEHLLFVRSFRLQGVFRVEERVELISQSYQKKVAVNVSLLLTQTAEAQNILLGCYGVFGRACFLPVKYMWQKYQGLCSKRTKYILFKFKYSAKTQSKMPSVALERVLKETITRPRDPLRGLYFLFCPINIDNNNTQQFCVTAGQWVESISHQTRDAISCACRNPAEYFNNICFEHLFVIFLQQLSSLRRFWG